jgi:hypothetical protein
MCKRADAVRRRETLQSSRRLAAPAQDHERDQLRQRHERLRAGAFRRAHETDCGTGQTGFVESRPQHLVDEHEHGPESRSARPEDDRVAALQHLRGDVDGDVRPRLEVRSDDSDRDAPLGHFEAVRQPPGANLALDPVERGGRAQAVGDAPEPAVVEPEPVERAGVEATLGGGEVIAVRLEDLVRALAQKPDGAFQCIAGKGVREPWQCRTRGERLLLDELERHGVRV